MWGQVCVAYIQPLCLNSMWQFESANISLTNSLATTSHCVTENGVLD